MERDHCFWAYLKKDSPFFGIFDKGIVPVKSYRPVLGTAPGTDEVLWYEIPITHITEDQLAKVCDIASEIHGGTASEAMEYYKEIDAIPLRVSATRGLAIKTDGRRP